MSSKPRNRRTRKRRTDASPSPSSDSSASDDASAARPSDRGEKRGESTKSSDANGAPSASSSFRDEQPVLVAETQPKDMDRTFEDLYLKQAAKEFADDLDKLRQAGDFKASSVDILVHALKQGTACFDPSEKARIVGALPHK